MIIIPDDLLDHPPDLLWVAELNNFTRLKNVFHRALVEPENRRCHLGVTVGRICVIVMERDLSGE